MDRVGEEEVHRDIEQLILGKYLLLVGEYMGRVRNATFLGRVVWWIFSSKNDGLYVCVWFKENISNLWVPFLDTMCF